MSTATRPDRGQGPQTHGRSLGFRARNASSIRENSGTVLPTALGIERVRSQGMSCSRAANGQVSGVSR